MLDFGFSVHNSAKKKKKTLVLMYCPISLQCQVNKWKSTRDWSRNKGVSGCGEQGET